MESPMDSGESSNPSLPVLETSMSTLIIWNISKVVEKNPHIDLRRAIRDAQECLERDPHDVNTIVSQSSERRHLACAMLAWQQLGHKDPDSLYRFIKTKQNEDQCRSSGISARNKDHSSKTTEGSSKATNNNICKDSIRSTIFDSHSQIGPVVKLPTETKVIMRSDTPTTVYVCSQAPKKKPREAEILSKINKACCLESACVERLSALDAATKELRTRATKLAKREAERVQLLERAETAWRDLELGYQRRLTYAEEKEIDLTRQTQKVIEERNRLKSVCLTLAPKLKTLGDVAEKARERLTQIEKDVCERACNRLRLMEQAAKENSIYSDCQCQAAQQDRDFQFKEQQAQRKVVSLENEVDSLRALTYETERALRSELGALREQITHVSKQLLAEDEQNCRIKLELEELRKEKMEIMEDLEGCKLLCDDRMQAKMEELRKKQVQLQEMEAVELECRCRLPVDAAVAVKRTPSLAALCSCSPEDKILDSCSCTSLRSRLLSTMLADLFAGLQVELGNVGADMPCQLLKCLEDRHNWDRASVVKSNLRNFFSKLLVGELDIAIASSIEKYHAKWVGASCADSAKMLPDLSDVEDVGWEKRAIERQAQKLAAELAEQMFEERAEQLAQRAKDIAAAKGPSPCECQPEKPSESQALYPCVVQQRATKGFRAVAVNKSASPNSSLASPKEWRLTPRDVTLLRTEIENLKKESIKKEDLRVMEQEIAKIVQLAASQDIEEESIKEETNKKDNKNRRPTNQVAKQNVNQNKLNLTNKRQPAVNYSKNINRASQYGGKTYKRPGQAYAVNLCLCDSKDPNKLIQQDKLQHYAMNKDSKVSWKQQRPPGDLLPQISGLKHTKPIQLPNQERSNASNSKTSEQDSCKSNCACFHKIPSNTSIDELLKTLAKWNCDLTSSFRKVSEKESLKPVSPKATELGDTIKDTCTTNIKFSKHKSEQDSEFDINYSRLLSKNETVIVNSLSNQMEENVTKITEFERHLPTAAESEYMGAINLDKSNENFCKCIINHKNITDVPLKCINSCSCLMKCLESKNKLVDSQRNVKSEAQTEKEKKYHPKCNSKLGKKEIKANEHFQTENQIISSLLNDNNQCTIDNKDKLSSFSINPVIVNSDRCDKPTGNAINTNKENQAQKTYNLDPHPHDRDYHIEFLGVTLTNATFNDIVVKDKAKESNFNSNNNQSYQNKDVGSSEIQETCVDVVKLQTYENHSCKQMSKSQCNIKLDELNKVFGCPFHKQRGDYNSNKDKALDTYSLKESNRNEQEPCVCCNPNGVEESNDLEVNTFNLLEEHLKEKLENLKLGCTSSFISADEKDKLFSTLVKKIKHVITESTSKVKCKCSEVDHSEGSWNRAYNLLQEYLKTKINRVQCMCDSQTESKKAILPEVTNKVYSLIEQDFQRLRDMYRCKNIQNSIRNIKSIERLKFEIPEKDTTICDEEVKVKEVVNKNDKLCDDKSNTSIVLSQNISSQVTPYFGMESKSCDAIESSHKCLQKTEAKTLTDMSNISIESPQNICHRSFEPDLELLIAEKVEVIEFAKDANDVSCFHENRTDPINIELKRTISIEQDLGNVDNFNEAVESNQIVALPYIGYTVNCSCNYNLGNCVCTKAKVQESNARIKNIWETYTSNNQQNRNFSYIMDNVNKRSSSLNFDEIIENSNVHTKAEDTKPKQYLCEAKTNTRLDDCSISLKDSRVRNHEVVKDITTNTFDEDTMIFETDYNSDDPLEWFECRSQPINEPRVTKFKSVHIPLDCAFSVKRETISDQHTNFPRSLSENCECNVVPICHVKMLMDNIEKKLVRSECTCDSLSSKVCPVHSQRSMP